jgi:hypothetical protein
LRARVAGVGLALEQQHCGQRQTSDGKYNYR